jgi:hypothetical protein
MGLLGVARANTAVGVSPETFLLLHIQLEIFRKFVFMLKLCKNVLKMENCKAQVGALQNKVQLELCKTKFRMQLCDMHARQKTNPVPSAIASASHRKERAAQIKFRHYKIVTVNNSIDVCQNYAKKRKDVETRLWAAMTKTTRSRPPAGMQ